MAFVWLEKYSLFAHNLQHNDIFIGFILISSAFLHNGEVAQPNEIFIMLSVMACWDLFLTV